MSQEIEIEFKNLLTQEEFFRLTQEFEISKNDFVKQTNYYFDTENFQLKGHKSALRVRMKNDAYTLTLKQQFEEHILETHQTLSKDVFAGLLKGKTLPEGAVYDVLTALNINVSKITYLGELTTLRAEFPYKAGLLVLDENQYLGKIDYEIEYESADYKVGLKNFNELLAEKKIPERITESKIARFFSESNRKTKS